MVHVVSLEVPEVVGTGGNTQSGWVNPYMDNCNYDLIGSNCMHSALTTYQRHEGFVNEKTTTQWLGYKV